ncbi:MAG: hypothetical protein U9N73_09600 [Candidatus Auribacterota bacterium]|nr:hypothetical protein [Candidatus Auribacterota bacterium]
MNWLKIDNQDIDTDKLQHDIEAEVEQVRIRQGEFASEEPEAQRTPPLQTPEKTPALIEISEAYAEGWDAATLARRRPILKPFLPILEKLLKKFLKPQYIFNSLLLEIIRKQEEKIQVLEKRINRKID